MDIHCGPIIQDELALACLSRPIRSDHLMALTSVSEEKRDKTKETTRDYTSLSFSLLFFVLNQK